MNARFGELALLSAIRKIEEEAYRKGQERMRKWAADIAEGFDGAFAAGVPRHSEWAGGSNYASIQIAKSVRALEPEPLEP